MTEERKSILGTGRASWVLVASIALNCFLVGVIANPLLGPKPMHQTEEKIGDAERKPPTEPAFMFERVAGELTPEESSKARAIFDEERKDFRENHKDMRAVMQKLAQILKAEKPDTAELRKVLEEVQTSGKSLHQGMGRTFERMATELSLESRQKIARTIEQRGDDRGPPRLPHEGRDGMKGPPPFDGGPFGPSPEMGGPERDMSIDKSEKLPVLGREPGQEPGPQIR